MNKAKQLIAEANPADRDITVWTDDEPDRKRIGEYYHDLLTQLGFNATLKVIAGDVYWTTIGNQSTPEVDTGFCKLVPGLPASRRLLPPASERGEHPADQRQQPVPGQHRAQQCQAGRTAEL